MDIINRFLETEVSYQEMYEEIVYFINSAHIRNGELEGNEFIIRKMDQTNFIIYLEYVLENGQREIHFATSIYRTILIKEIQAYAEKKGLILHTLN